MVAAPETRTNKPMMAVPKYPTLVAVLALDAEPVGPETRQEIDDLAAAMATGDVDWKRYGL